MNSLKIDTNLKMWNKDKIRGKIAIKILVLQEEAKWYQINTEYQMFQASISSKVH